MEEGNRFEGVLPIWKPAGLTSHDVVAKVRRMLRIKRIGHTGTLDPAVTGVLPLCIERATRLVEYIQELPKQYEAVLRIGQTTDTEDLQGTVLTDEPGIRLSESEIRDAIKSFIGPIEQIPPMYSAVKVDGKRLYELARAGEEIERKPRPVHIYNIEILSMSLDRPYPEIAFRVDCSKGTYIRTLCVDIGKALGVPAAMAGLIRSATGPFTKESCVPLDQVEQMIALGVLQTKIVPIDQAISHLPSIAVPAELALKARQGQSIAPPDAIGLQGPVRLYEEPHRFIGIFEANAEGRLSPAKVFH